MGECHDGRTSWRYDKYVNYWLQLVRVMARENRTRKEECEISYEMRFSKRNSTEDKRRNMRRNNVEFKWEIFEIRNYMHVRNDKGKKSEEKMIKIIWRIERLYMNLEVMEI